MFKLIIKDLAGQMHIIPGYFPTKREAEQYLLSIEQDYKDYVIVSRRKFEAEMGIRRPFELQYIKKPPKDLKYHPPFVHRKKKDETKEQER